MGSLSIRVVKRWIEHRSYSQTIVWSHSQSSQLKARKRILTRNQVCWYADHGLWISITAMKLMSVVEDTPYMLLWYSAQKLLILLLRDKLSWKGKLFKDWGISTSLRGCSSLDGEGIFWMSLNRSWPSVRVHGQWSDISMLECQRNSSECYPGGLLGRRHEFWNSREIQNEIYITFWQITGWVNCRTEEFVKTLTVLLQTQKQWVPLDTLCTSQLR